eukprot:16437207-Heterocapsa_arctica.AAC.1
MDNVSSHYLDRTKKTTQDQDLPTFDYTTLHYTTLHYTTLHYTIFLQQASSVRGFCFGVETGGVKKERSIQKPK